jgi:ribosomal protein S18 acetylase RimI-like enzyme
MPLTHRSYRDDADLARMLTLVSGAAVREGALAGYMPVGDVVWGLFQNLTIDPAERIRLFEDSSGALRGFAWRFPPHDIEFQIDPAGGDGDGLFAAMLCWAEEEGDGEPVRLLIAGANACQEALARANGYGPTGEADHQVNHRDLATTSIADAKNDITIRPMRLDDPDEVAARVALHREVWHPSRFSAEGYARLRTKPVYRPDLDLVAVTPAGELAAYCIVWWDPATRVIEFEPVGTAERFRGQGIGKALILAGLRRGRALGARDAIVLSETGEHGIAARALYASAGFRLAFRYEVWTKTPAEAPAGA